MNKHFCAARECETSLSDTPARTGTDSGIIDVSTAVTDRPQSAAGQPTSSPEAAETDVERGKCGLGRSRPR